MQSALSLPPTPTGDPCLLGRADLHLHTTFSDGRDTPAEVMERAAAAGLDVIAITDHDSIDGALIGATLARLQRTRLEVIVGTEVSSRDGHILGLFLESPIAPGLSAEATVAAIHSQGGLAIAAHPYWRAYAGNPVRYSYGVGDLVRVAGFDGIEVVNGGFTPSMVRANAAAEAVNAELRLGAVGGSDAHVKEAIGWAHTEFPGTSAADLRRAIELRATGPATRPLSLLGLARYLAWGLGRARPGLRPAMG